MDAFDLYGIPAETSNLGERFIPEWCATGNSLVMEYIIKYSHKWKYKTSLLGWVFCPAPNKD